MRLLVTGAAGMLGRELSRRRARAGHAVTGLARAELDSPTPPRSRDAVAARRRPTPSSTAPRGPTSTAPRPPRPARGGQRRRRRHVARRRARAGALLRARLHRLRLRRRARPAARTSRPTRPARSAPTARTKLAGEHAVLAARRRHAGGAHALAVRRRRPRTSSPRCCALGARARRGHASSTTRSAAHLDRPPGAGAARAPSGGVDAASLHLAGGGSCSWFELRRGDVLPRPASTARCAREHAPSSAARRRGRPVACSGPSATTRSRCPTGTRGSPAISPSARGGCAK